MDISPALQVMLPVFLALAAVSVLAIGLGARRHGQVSSVRVVHSAERGPEIVIRPVGMFRILGSRARIPAGRLTAAFPVAVQRLGPAPRQVAGIRFPATRFPGLFAGAFGQSGRHTLWACASGRPTLRMDFQGGPYDHAIVQVPNVAATLDALKQVKAASRLPHPVTGPAIRPGPRARCPRPDAAPS